VAVRHGTRGASEFWVIFELKPSSKKFMHVVFRSVGFFFKLRRKDYFYIQKGSNFGVWNPRVRHCANKIFKEPQAGLVPIDSLQGTPASPGKLEHTLRFFPKSTGTSGMFIAKIQKNLRMEEK
jgi:hypothetical protein